MRWGRGRSLTYYCHDVTCPGAGGFEVAPEREVVS